MPIPAPPPSSPLASPAFLPLHPIRSSPYSYDTVFPMPSKSASSHLLFASDLSKPIRTLQNSFLWCWGDSQVTHVSIWATACWALSMKPQTPKCISSLSNHMFTLLLPEELRNKSFHFLLWSMGDTFEGTLKWVCTMASTAAFWILHVCGSFLLFLGWL